MIAWKAVKAPQSDLKTKKLSYFNDLEAIASMEQAQALQAHQIIMTITTEALPKSRRNKEHWKEERR